jgi:hypothetical protein
MGDLVNVVEKLALSKDGKAERHDQQRSISKQYADKLKC